MSGLLLPASAALGPDPLLSDFARANFGAGPALVARTREGLADLFERWQDDASEAALAGRPERAAVIEDIAGRHLFGYVDRELPPILFGSAAR